MKIKNCSEVGPSQQQLDVICEFTQKVHNFLVEEIPNVVDKIPGSSNINSSFSFTIKTACNQNS